MRHRRTAMPAYTVPPCCPCIWRSTTSRHRSLCVGPPGRFDWLCALDAQRIWCHPNWQSYCARWPMWAPWAPRRPIAGIPVEELCSALFQPPTQISIRPVSFPVWDFAAEHVPRRRDLGTVNAGNENSTIKCSWDEIVITRSRTVQTRE